MLFQVLWFIAGLIALIWGADLLVRGASRLAVSFGISKLIVGLTVVAFGTSAPEMAVSIQSGLQGQTDLMLGNIIGSNLANILLVLGIASLIYPIRVQSKLIRVDVPVMIGVTILLFLFSLNGFITFWESLIFVLLLITYLLFLARENRVQENEYDFESKRSGRKLTNFLLLCGGFILLVLGARWLVQSATQLALWFGISELVIGLTIVAFGTSLPEVATSVIAAIKGERDIAVGNIVGSNIMNILAVLGITGLIIPEPIAVQTVLLHFDLIILTVVSIACLPIFFTGHKISRWEGAIFLFYFIAYMLYLLLYSVQHDTLPIYSTIILFFALPLMLLTIFTFAVREWKKRKRVWDLMHNDN